MMLLSMPFSSKTVERYFSMAIAPAMVAGLVVTSASAAANIAFRGAAVASEKPSDDSLSASNAAIKILGRPMVRADGAEDGIVRARNNLERRCCAFRLGHDFVSRWRLI